MKRIRVKNRTLLVTMPIRNNSPRHCSGAQFPGQNSTAINPDLLLKIRGITHDQYGIAVRSEFIAPGSNLVVRKPPDSKWMIYGFTIEFLVCEVMQSSSAMQAASNVLVAWYVPPLIPGKKGGNKIDIFGSWTPVAKMQLKDLYGHKLPDPLASLALVMDANFEMTENNELPYDTLDTLRVRHRLDVTALSLSQTTRGNLYRAYVLQKEGGQPGA